MRLLFIKYFLFTTLLSLTYLSYSQSVNKDRSVYNINTGVINFLIKAGELTKEKNIDDNVNQITIVEIVDKESLENIKTGIFLFRSLHVPSTTYIMLRDGRKYKILDLFETTKTIKCIVKFLKRHKFPKDEIIKYIEEVITIYHYNCYSCKYKL